MSEREWKERAAKMLQLAELNLRRAQVAHDGSDAARRRYVRARELFKEAESLAGVLIDPPRFEAVFDAHDRELERARLALEADESTSAQRRFALALFRRERLYAQFLFAAAAR